MSTSSTALPVAHAPRWHRRKEARPAEILAAALETFVAHGYAATRLDDVARRAGVTKGTMYLYFKGKEALFKAVVSEALVENIMRGERLVDEHEGGTRELLERILASWLDSIGRPPASGIPKLMIAEAANFPDLGRFYYDEVVRRGQRLLGRVIRRGIERGEFRPVPVEHAVRLAIAPILLGAVLKHSFHACSGDELDPRENLAHHLDVFLRGIEMVPHAEVPNA